MLREGKYTKDQQTQTMELLHEAPLCISEKKAGKLLEIKASCRQHQRCSKHALQLHKPHLGSIVVPLLPSPVLVQELDIGLWQCMGHHDPRICNLTRGKAHEGCVPVPPASGC